MFVSPRLRPPIVRVPRALREAVAALPDADAGEGGASPSITAEEERRARAFLSAWIGGRPAPHPDRRTLRALVYRVYPQVAPKVQAQIAGALAALEGVHWKLLWELWSNGESAVLTPLARALERRLADPRAAARIPAWLGRNPANVAAALQDPQFAVRAHCEGQRIPLSRLPAGLELYVDRGPGREAIGRLIAHGSDAWWSLSPPPEARRWVEGRSLPLILAVADRLLQSHGGAAQSPAQVPRNGESRALLAWLKQTLGVFHPRRPPWPLLSSRALQILEWLTMMGEFDRIIEEFRRDADPRRAEFWSRYTRGLRDARCYSTNRSSVCMLAFENVLVVEFGAVGNACYVYRLPSTWTPLWQRSFATFTRPEEFKSKDVLELGADRFPYVDAMRHAGDWEATFDYILRNYRVTPDRPASTSWRY